MSYHKLDRFNWSGIKDITSMNIIGCDHQLINDTSICLIDIAVISANIIELECNETTTMKLE